jgi:hypothetical protein
MIDTIAPPSLEQRSSLLLLVQILEEPEEDVQLEE